MIRYRIPSRSLELVAAMLKQIFLPLWFCSVLVACALPAGLVVAQATDRSEVANRTVVTPTVASLNAPAEPTTVKAAEEADAADEMEPENAQGVAPPAEQTVAAPPPLPPCPLSAASLEERIAGQICQRVRAEPPPTSLKVGDYSMRSLEAVLRFYAQRSYRAGWLDASGRPVTVADDLLKAIAEAELEGLRSADYRPAELRKRLDAVRQGASDAERAEFDLLFTDTFLTYGAHLLAGRIAPQQVDPEWAFKPRSRDLAAALQEALSQHTISAALQGFRPQSQGYLHLREVLRQYREVAAAGGWPTVASSLAQGARGPRVEALRARLRAGGDLSASGAADPNGAVFDNEVVNAVRRFQKRHGLAETGAVNAATQTALNVPVAQRIRQVELNLERWRWLPDAFGSRYILVNIPSFKMKVIEDGKAVIESNVVVGREERQTPAFTADMAYLVLSPKWYVPRSIAVKDKLPQLKRNPRALARQNIRVFNSAGREISPSSVNWRAVSANNFNYQLRQDAGPGNALGGIKFMFPNPYSIYLHDTPSRGLFSRSQRMFSSGCIRISNPVELAQYLLKHDPKWTRERIKSASVSGKQRVVNLPEAVPVYLLYWTAWVDEAGLMNFRNDIYQRDKPLVRALYAGEAIPKGV